jgi:hypothetical protein
MEQLFQLSGEGFDIEELARLFARGSVTVKKIEDNHRIGVSQQILTELPRFAAKSTGCRCRESALRRRFRSACKSRIVSPTDAHC